MSIRLVRVSGLRRSTTLVAGVVIVGGLAAYSGLAGAAPRPTVNQVQARVNQLTTQFDKVSQQLDQASQQLSAAQSKLTGVRVRLDHANSQFREAQANVAQNAAAAFEDTGATSVAGMLTSGDPTAGLQRGALLIGLAGNQNAQTRPLRVAARHPAHAHPPVPPPP